MTDKEDNLFKTSDGFVVANRSPVRNHITNCDIAIYNHMYSHEFCDMLIDNYEMGSELKFSYTRAQTGELDSTLKQDTSVNVIEPWETRLQKIDNDYFMSNSTRIYKLFAKSFDEIALNFYVEDAKILPETFEHFKIEALKLQKTKPSEGYHVWHYEAGKIDTIRRICFFILYLNDVAEGGETEFLKQRLRVVPEKGTLIIAPANYTAMHRGNPPLSGDKYILTGWVTI